MIPHFFRSRALKKGFTLVELMIYMALISILAVVFVSFAFDVIGTSEKGRLRQELQQNARFAMDRMTQEIRASASVNTGASTFGVHPGVLSLGTNDGATNPTIFDVDAGVLRVKLGAASAAALTDSKFAVTNLAFENLSVSGRTSNIRINLTLTHADAGVQFAITGAAQVRALAD